MQVAVITIETSTFANASRFMRGSRFRALGMWPIQGCEFLGERQMRVYPWGKLSACLFQDFRKLEAYPTGAFPGRRCRFGKSNLHVYHNPEPISWSDDRGVLQHRSLNRGWFLRGPYQVDSSSDFLRGPSLHALEIIPTRTVIDVRTGPSIGKGVVELVGTSFNLRVPGDQGRQARVPDRNASGGQQRANQQESHRHDSFHSNGSGSLIMRKQTGIITKIYRTGQAGFGEEFSLASRL